MQSLQSLSADALHLGALVWVSDPSEGYIEGVVTALDGKKITVEVRGGKPIVVGDTVSALMSTPLRKLKRDPEHRLLTRYSGGPPDGVPNMDELINLNEAEVLANMSTRFRMDKIYTRVGPILIAMNPFKFLPIYGQDIIQQYHNRPYHSLPPHCYAEAEDAYRMLMGNASGGASVGIGLGLPQTVIICGESGAGKTETTKLMLEYISVVSRPKTSSGETMVTEKGVRSIGDRMVESNPLMEAFGNAKTTRNNNSSRFGKFTAYHFNATGAIIGGKITNLLLEKTRVVKRPMNERNFHIFYQLIAGDWNGEDSGSGGGGGGGDMDVALDDPDDFYYLNQSGCTTVDGMVDADEFSTTTAAMDAAGMSKELQSSIMRAIAGILHLGNVSFLENSEGGEAGCTVNRQQEAVVNALGHAARLFGVDAEALVHALTVRVRELPNGGVVESPQTAAESVDSRDALAKAIYSKMFDYLVTQVNQAFEGATGLQAMLEQKRYIGILDIFGFEDLEPNGFEQLFINFTNEQLQYLFNDVIFKQEETEYEAEKIQWDKQLFPDNQPCIDLLSKRPMGLLPFMDSEAARGQAGSSASLVAKYHKAHRTHANYGPCGLDTKWRHKDGSYTEASEFVIIHYAGPIIYSSEGFLEKTRDVLYNNVQTLMQQQSTSALIRTIFDTGLPAGGAKGSSGGGGGAGTVTNTSSSGGGGGGGERLSMPGGVSSGQRFAGQTVASRFLTQLKELMEDLKDTHIRFVRCIKTNDDLSPSFIDKPRVLSQLVCSGVTAALEVRRAGYPTRIKYEDFVKSFRVFGTFMHGQAFSINARGSGAVSQQPQLSAKEQAAKYMMNPAVVKKVRAEQFRLGVTKIFLQADVLLLLEGIKNSMVLPMVRRLQQWWITIRADYMQHKLLSCMRTLGDVKAKARLARVHTQTKVKLAAADADNAARYARGLETAASTSKSMTVSPPTSTSSSTTSTGGGGGGKGADVTVLKAAMETLEEKVRMFSQVVETAAALKQKEVRERAELLELLDNGQARIKTIRGHMSLLNEFNTAALNTLVLKSDRGLELCRAELLRFQQMENVTSGGTRANNATQAGSSSTAMRRALNRAENQAAGGRRGSYQVAMTNTGRRGSAQSAQDAAVVTSGGLGLGGLGVGLAGAANTGLASGQLQFGGGEMTSVGGGDDASMMGLGDDDIPVDFEGMDLESRRQKVMEVVAIVREAEDMCADLTRQREEVEAARLDHKDRLSKASNVLEEVVLSSASVEIITGHVINVLDSIDVSDVVKRARAAVENAAVVLMGLEIGLYENSVDEAVRLVEEAKMACVDELAKREDEAAREASMLTLQNVQKEVDEVRQKAMEEGLDGIPSLAAVLEDVKKAVQRAVAFEASGGQLGELDTLVGAAAGKKQRLKDVFSLEKAKKDVEDKERKQEMDLLLPAMTRLTAIKDKASLAGIAQEEGIRKALNAAEQAVRTANDAIHAPSSGGGGGMGSSAHSGGGGGSDGGGYGAPQSAVTRKFLTKEAIAAVDRCEAELRAGRARREAIQSELRAAHVTLVNLQRRLEDLDHVVNTSSPLLASLLTPSLSAAVSAVSAASTVISEASHSHSQFAGFSTSVGAIRSASLNAVRLVKNAEEVQRTASETVEEGERQRAKSRRTVQELSRRLTVIRRTSTQLNLEAKSAMTALALSEADAAVLKLSLEVDHEPTAVTSSSSSSGLTSSSLGGGGGGGSAAVYLNGYGGSGGGGGGGDEQQQQHSLHMRAASGGGGVVTLLLTLSTAAETAVQRADTAVTTEGRRAEAERRENAALAQVLSDALLQLQDLETKVDWMNKVIQSSSTSSSSSSTTTATVTRSSSSRLIDGDNASMDNTNGEVNVDYYNSTGSVLIRGDSGRSNDGQPQLQQPQRQLAGVVTEAVTSARSNYLMARQNFDQRVMLGEQGADAASFTAVTVATADALQDFRTEADRAEEALAKWTEVGLQASRKRAMQQETLGAILLQLQGVVAMVSASGSGLAKLCESDLRQASEVVGRAYHMFVTTQQQQQTNTSAAATGASSSSTGEGGSGGGRDNVGLALGSGEVDAAIEAARLAVASAQAAANTYKAEFDSAYAAHRKCLQWLEQLTDQLEGVCQGAAQEDLQEKDRAVRHAIETATSALSVAKTEALSVITPLAASAMSSSSSSTGSASLSSSASSSSATRVVDGSGAGAVIETASVKILKAAVQEAAMRINEAGAAVEEALSHRQDSRRRADLVVGKLDWLMRRHALCMKAAKDDRPGHLASNISNDAEVVACFEQVEQAAQMASSAVLQMEYGGGGLGLSAGAAAVAAVANLEAAVLREELQVSTTKKRSEEERMRKHRCGGEVIGLTARIAAAVSTAEVADGNEGVMIDHLIAQELSDAREAVEELKALNPDLDTLAVFSDKVAKAFQTVQVLESVVMTQAAVVRKALTKQSLEQDRLIRAGVLLDQLLHDVAVAPVATVGGGGHDGSDHAVKEAKEEAERAMEHAKYAMSAPLLTWIEGAPASSLTSSSTSALSPGNSSPEEAVSRAVTAVNSFAEAVQLMKRQTAVTGQQERVLSASLALQSERVSSLRILAEVHGVHSPKLNASLEEAESLLERAKADEERAGVGVSVKQQLIAEAAAIIAGASRELQVRKQAANRIAQGRQMALQSLTKLKLQVEAARDLLTSCSVLVSSTSGKSGSSTSGGGVGGVGGDKQLTKKERAAARVSALETALGKSDKEADELITLLKQQKSGGAGGDDDAVDDAQVAIVTEQRVNEAVKQGMATVKAVYAERERLGKEQRAWRDAELLLKWKESAAAAGAGGGGDRRGRAGGKGEANDAGGYEPVQQRQLQAQLYAASSKLDERATMLQITTDIMRHTEQAVKTAQAELDAGASSAASDGSGGGGRGGAVSYDQLTNVSNLMKASQLVEAAGIPLSGVLVGLAEATGGGAGERGVVRHGGGRGGGGGGDGMGDERLGEMMDRQTHAIEAMTANMYFLTQANRK